MRICTTRWGGRGKLIGGKNKPIWVEKPLSRQGPRREKSRLRRHLDELLAEMSS